jgi:dUTP pyrophosphatase
MSTWAACDRDLRVKVDEAAQERQLGMQQSPYRLGHPGDAGIDLYVRGRLGQTYYEILPHQFVDLPAGCSVALPEGYWGLITGRSSTIRQRGLMVTQGVIDNGYRGPLFAGVWNLTSRPVRVAVGDRVAQLILLPTWAGRVALVDELPDTMRGTDGFGSTGGIQSGQS